MKTLSFNQKKWINPLWIVFSVGMLLLLSACSHYYLGRSHEIGFTTLAILPIENDSLAPQIQGILSDQLMHTLISDGTVKIVRSEDAEATLQVTIIEFNQSLNATQEQDTGLARSYNLQLAAECTLINKKKNEVLLNNTLISSTLNLQVDTHFVDAQYQAMPALARDLAQKIRDRILNNW